jgi:hypothetical protein
MNVVFVYLGKKLPQYFIRNITYFQKTFPNIRHWVVTDENKVLQKLLSSGFNAYFVGEELKEAFDEMSVRLSHDMSFRSGFWMKTIGRFHAIQNLMIEENLEKVIHVEGDVLCLPQFPFEKFEKMKQGVAYPLEAPDLGIASVLFIQNTKAMNLLIAFTEEEINRNPQTTDMRILGRFAKEYESEVFLLPTFSLEDQVNSIYSGRSIVQSIIANEGKFQGVFDSVSLGQYLFGVDPKNSRGVVKKFLTNNNHFVNPRKFEFLKSGESIAVANSNGHLSSLFSLHIHSKELSAFNYPLNLDLILENYEESKFGESTTVRMGVMLAQIFKSLTRRASVFKK